MTFFTMQQIKNANEAAGHLFFERGAMRFFRSKIATRRPIGGKYFVTSEQIDERSPRLYSVRIAREDGRVNTIGGFQAYGTLAAAKRAIRDLIKAEAK